MSLQFLSLWSRRTTLHEVVEHYRIQIAAAKPYLQTAQASFKESSAVTKQSQTPGHGRSFYSLAAAVVVIYVVAP